MSSTADASKVGGLDGSSNSAKRGTKRKAADMELLSGKLCTDTYSKRSQTLKEKGEELEAKTGAYVVLFTARPETIGTGTHRLFVSENLRKASPAISQRVSGAIDEIRTAAMEVAHPSRPAAHRRMITHVTGERSGSTENELGSVMEGPHDAHPSRITEQETLDIRLARLQYMIESALPGRSPSPSTDGHSEYSDDQDPSGGSFQAGKWYGVGSSENMNTEPTPADSLEILLTDYGVSGHQISELTYQLPPQASSDILVDYYFTSIDWTRYPISERNFRAAYSSVSGGAVTKVDDILFLPLLFVVLAIAIRFIPEGDAPTKRLHSQKFYWSSRQAFLIATAIQPDSLNVVLTGLLSAKFLSIDRRITECWSELGAAVRTAQSLGLHRDGITMGMDPSIVEYRRRVWSCLYYADRTYALMLGRPVAIRDDYTTTRPPLNVDNVLSGAHVEPQPLSCPTSMTFIILRHCLASIIGRVVDHFQQLRTPCHYSEVIHLDEEILRFVRNLPPHFAIEPDTSLDVALPYIPVHRFLLITEIHFVRISLHRPYLLMLQSDRYLRSRIACFETVKKDFQVRQASRLSMPKETWDSLNSPSRVFQTAMISGICLVLEPSGKDAPTMHAILDAFMEDHRERPEMDNLMRQELKVIHFLKEKSSQMAYRGRLVNDRSVHSPLQRVSSLREESRQVDVTSPLTSVPAPDSQDVSSSTRDEMATDTLPSSPFYSHRHSSNSSSPNEDTTAQSLLDLWCDNHSFGSMSDNAMNWSGNSGSDAELWPRNQSVFVPADSSFSYGLDDLWENLVDHLLATD